MYDSRMRMLVFGAKGYMGGQFLAKFPGAIPCDADIGDRAAVIDALEKNTPDIVLNAAGKTGRPNVDWCEDHKEETLHSNVLGPIILLEECLSRNILLVHVSSGCIYSGDNGGGGFTEEDAPNFAGSFYSRTKTWSDQIMRDFPVLNLRIRMPFDGTGSPRSLITKISKYPKVLDSDNSITYVPDFLDATEKLITKRKTGTFNIVNEGAISPFRIMQLYKDIVDPAHTFEKLSEDKLGTVTKAGRSNCILSTAKLKGEGIALRPVEDAVREALQSIKNSR
jgi:dTDP-4-dehydrorhamnose reductase